MSFWSFSREFFCPLNRRLCFCVIITLFPRSKWPPDANVARNVAFDVAPDVQLLMSDGSNVS